jgi:hypothetical protein
VTPPVDPPVQEGALVPEALLVPEEAAASLMQSARVNLPTR